MYQPSDDGTANELRRQSTMLAGKCIGLLKQLPVASSVPTDKDMESDFIQLSLENLRANQPSYVSFQNYERNLKHVQGYHQYLQKGHVGMEEAWSGVMSILSGTVEAMKKGESQGSLSM